MTNTFKGQLRRVRYVKDDSSWAVVVMEGNQIACGPPPAGGFAIGAEYVLAGRWVENEKFGRQFKYTSISLAVPVTCEGVIAYLQKTCDGIGPTIARRIWELYGEESCEALRANPDDVAANVKGLSSARASAAAEVLRERMALEEVNIQLSSLLDGYGFRSTVYNDVLEKWGVDAARRIRSNPFCLLTDRIPSVGFRRVDKLYCDLNVGNPAKLQATKRLAIAGWWSIKNDGSGHTWYNVNKINMALKELGVEQWDLNKILTLLRRAKWVEVREFNGQQYVTDSDRAHCERHVAAMLAEHMSAPLDLVRLASQGSLTNHQYNKANIALSTPIGILCGTPGTGKTFTAGRIVRELSKRYLVAVAAPTGKAAVRCTAALEQCGSNIVATTVHTLLAPRFNAGRMTFTYNAENLLPYDVVVIDESSMMDMPLFRSLLCALHPLARLLLVGDPYQLPPVGWGQPMNDLIKHGRVGIGELTEIHRNSGAIVVGCQKIKSGFVPIFPERFVPGDPSTNLLHMQASGENATLSALLSALHKCVDKSIDLSKVQVIVPTNDSGLLGRSNLNILLQNQFNPNGYRVEGNRFRVGDKAIILKNRIVPGISGRVAVHEVRDWSEVYVANGDVGRVVEVTARNTWIHIVNPDRTIRVGPAIVREEKEARKDRLAEPKSEENSSFDFDLAYAITCHKSQGSGYPFVFVILDPAFGAKSVTSRQWIYTATSRAEELCMWIGDKKIAKEMIGKVANYRMSFLTDEIDALVGEYSDGTEASNGVAVPVCDLGGYAGAEAF